jgi:hypothetical protein
MTIAPACLFVKEQPGESTDQRELVFERAYLIAGRSQNMVSGVRFQVSAKTKMIDGIGSKIAGKKMRR